ncbi:hypothetical protein NEFER03_1833 [Nematocida sp. LUAm3]|nr:hypothetical protein NEFER03_1833 [Nematocida sp. LUAm3]KAI5173860.1 hypothetical protein NEFER02_0327 [Nematocida sp. LUAm2]KAI5177395.1 hypothetical protein NEFER01_0670 [Nematocida sp. LUAm1]
MSKNSIIKLIIFGIISIIGLVAIGVGIWYITRTDQSEKDKDTSISFEKGINEDKSTSLTPPIKNPNEDRPESKDLPTEKPNENNATPQDTPSPLLPPTENPNENNAASQGVPPPPLPPLTQTKTSTKDGPEVKASTQKPIDKNDTHANFLAEIQKGVKLKKVHANP